MFFRTLKKNIMVLNNNNIYKYSKRISSINTHNTKPTRFIFNIIWSKDYKHYDLELLYHN